MPDDPDQMDGKPKQAPSAEAKDSSTPESPAAEAAAAPAEPPVEATTATDPSASDVKAAPAVEATTAKDPITATDPPATDVKVAPAAESTAAAPESATPTPTVPGAPAAVKVEPAAATPREKVEELAAPAVKSNDPGVTIRLVGRTDVGLVREHNEDSYLVVRLDDASRDPAALRVHALGEKGTLCVVCDGMGGAAAGEVASNMATESIASTMLADALPEPPPGAPDEHHTKLARKLRMAAKDANTQIFREARSNLSRSGMGTTMTAVLFNKHHALIAQVGDSRAYVWRAGNFTQVTRDQSLVNQLLETGHITPEQAKFFEHSNVILQALGVQEDVEVQLSKVELRRGDRFMVCSDGLVGVVTDEEIGAVLGACEDPDEAGRILIEMANGAGGPDNISVIVAHVVGDGVPVASDDDLLSYQLWKIDPDLPPPSGSDEPATQPAMSAASPYETTARRTRTRSNPTAELVSMAVVFGLVLGSVMTGAVIYRNGVSCRVEARASGLSVLADGHDTGIRTPSVGDGSPSSVQVRLRPGHHTLSLRGAGAPEGTREIEVQRGETCEASFGVPSSQASATPPPEDPDR